MKTETLKHRINQLKKSGRNILASDVAEILNGIIDAIPESEGPTVVKFPAITGDDGKWYVPAQYEADLMAAIESGTLIYLYNDSILEEYAIILGYDGENPIKAFGTWNAEIEEVAFGTPTES